MHTENEIKILVKDEYGEQLEEIAHENEQKINQLKQKNEQKINQMKNLIQQLNKIPNLNKDAQKIINKLNKI